MLGDPRLTLREWQPEMFKSYSTFYVETVYRNADSRFAFESWKSQVSDSEDSVIIQEESESKV